MFKFKNKSELVLTCIGLFLPVVLTGQTELENSIVICDKPISFEAPCVGNQNFQSVKCAEFDLMWLYLITKPGFTGSSISKNTMGEVTYTSSYTFDLISKNGFSIYPKKNDEVFLEPITVLLAGAEISGYIIEVKGKKSNLYYLTAAGPVCDHNIGLQVKLSQKPNNGTELPSELQKVLQVSHE